MWIDRIEVTLELDVLQPLSVLSGEQDRENKQATLMLDVDGLPCIPGSTLKGALRAQFDGDIDGVFGMRSHEDDGARGTLIMHAARLIDWPNRERGAAAAKTVTTRTAIARKTGTADDSKLFTLQAVPSGSRFRTALTLFMPPDATRSTAERKAESLALAARLLAPFAAGLPLGRGKRLGNGTLKFAGASAVAHIVGADGDLVSTSLGSIDGAVKAAAARPEPPLVRIAFGLSTSGAFAIGDAAGGRTSEVGERLQAPMLKDRNGSPVLLGSSLLGALRSEAAWFAELLWLKGEGAKAGIPGDRLSSRDSADDRFLEADVYNADAARRGAVSEVSDLARLSSIERLFGVPGWAGLLNLNRLELREAGRPFTQVQIAVDRLSGGALNGALVHREVAYGPQWDVELAITPGEGRLESWRPHAAIDIEFLRLFTAHIRNAGITLGGGSARGAGWMDVAQLTTHFEDIR